VSRDRFRVVLTYFRNILDPMLHRFKIERGATGNNLESLRSGEHGAGVGFFQFPSESDGQIDGIAVLPFCESADPAHVISAPCSDAVRVSSRACSWASGDRPAPTRPHGSALPVLSGRSCCQRLVGNATSSRRHDEAIQPLKGLALHVAVIQAEGELVDVAAKVLAAGVVIDANDAPFHDRENAFNAVRGDVATHVFARSVVDRIMAEEQSADPGVAHAGLLWCRDID